ARDYMSVLATYDLIGVRLGEYPSPEPLDRARESADVLERMELRLIWIPDCRPGIEEIERRALDTFDRHSSPLRGFLLVVQRLDLFSGRQEQKPVDALEITRDAFGARDLLDPVDGREMTRRRQARNFSPAPALHHRVAVVHRASQMRRGPARDPATDASVIQNDHATAAFDQMVGDREPGDARADHDHVSDEVTVEPGIGGNLNGCRPDGDVAREMRPGNGGGHAVHTRSRRPGVGVNA